MWNACTEASTYIYIYIYIYLVISKTREFWMEKWTDWTKSWVCLVVHGTKRLFPVPQFPRKKKISYYTVSTQRKSSAEDMERLVGYTQIRWQYFYFPMPMVMNHESFGFRIIRLHFKSKNQIRFSLILSLLRGFSQPLSLGFLVSDQVIFFSLFIPLFLYFVFVIWVYHFVQMIIFWYVIRIIWKATVQMI